ncbi:MAG TPA: hypothetical protein VFR31_06130 [Thermoanaerobaculia bacterium]|nr:hypothetical protein [Thermoanaerobaculia bacterium]
MKRALIVLALGVVLGLFGFQPVESASAASPSLAGSVPDGTEGAAFLAWLDGQKPLPASAGCSTSVRCYSTGQLLGCSGTTSCYKFLGCYVICDDVQYDCPPGGPFACP